MTKLLLLSLCLLQVPTFAAELLANCYKASGNEYALGEQIKREALTSSSQLGPLAGPNNCPLFVFYRASSNLTYSYTLGMTSGPVGVCAYFRVRPQMSQDDPKAMDDLAPIVTCSITDRPLFQK